MTKRAGNDSSLKASKKRKVAEEEQLSGDDVEALVEAKLQSHKKKEEEVALEEAPKKKKKIVKKKKVVKKTKAVEGEEKAPVESVDENEEKDVKDKEKDVKDEEESVAEEEEEKGRSSQVTTSTSFKTLGLSENLQKGLDEAGFDNMFEIQARSIPHLMIGSDVLGAAKTGSGKTLAFLVPMIDNLVRTKFIQRNGTGVLVIAPTRELADQIYGVAREIMKNLSQTHGVVLGGMNRREEARRLEKGVNVLVATPGRLLDHMQNTRGFVYHNLIGLVLDEADRILEIGFEEEMKAILALLPKTRQTALFSATQTKKVADLARLSLNNKPVFIEVKSNDSLATREGLQQGYCVCNADKRFLLLFTFLKKEKNKKIMVFMSSKHAVKYFHDLLNYIDVPVSCIHGDKKQTQRQSTFNQFSTAETGIMLCTDVAARGLDIPRVDWIVQYDPPDDPREYIHRVGRTARGAHGKGKALLFLLPEELGFLRYLKQAGVVPNEFTVPENKVKNIQSQLERLIEKNFHLHRGSRDAYRSYIHAYAAHSLKDCFEVQKLDLAKVAKSFGFASPPKVELGLKHRGSKKDKKKIMTAGPGAASGHKFSADNPYGKKEGSDKRQFVH